MQLNDIKGLGSKRIELLNKANIFTPIDLISRFPYKYLDLDSPTDFSMISTGDFVWCEADFTEKPKVIYIKKSMSIVKVKLFYSGYNIVLSYFNQPFIVKKFSAGGKYLVYGKVKIIKKNDTFEISNAGAIDVDLLNTRIYPLYRRVKGIPEKTFTEAIMAVLSKINVEGFLDDKGRNKFHLMPLNSAFSIIHKPILMEEIALAQRTIALEKLSYSLAVFSIIKKTNSDSRQHFYLIKYDKLKEFINKLPFVLTNSQKQAIKDMLSDLHSSKKMNRLLNGDVGSGKTIVVFALMYYAYLSGFQSALMAPTEILAIQHYKNAISLFSQYGINVALLTSSTKAVERRKILSQLKQGDINILIGTHSLLNDEVEFHNLSLVITDEQHRFGVAQRSKLEEKSLNVDTIVMSATPIPRTLALSIYGDLKQSKLTEKPKNKAKVITKLVPHSKESNMWQYMIDKANIGEQSIVVCPRIEEDDDLLSAELLYKEKSKTINNIGLIHGKMSDKKKNEVMQAFVSNEIKILIATTVIEVGIDVPNATTIVIYNCERYGLSQLHQLRGRVGRGTKTSYCFLLSDNDNPLTQERLNYLLKTDDGFVLSEYDFKLRGAGDFLGNNQHGKNGDFVIGVEEITTANAIANYYLAHPLIRSEIYDTINVNRFDFYKNITLN